MHRALASKEIEDVLSGERIVRIGMGAAGERYLLPVGYLWYDGFIYFASTPGKKTRILEANPEVSFQIDTSATSGIYDWKSVTGEGRVEFVEVAAELDGIRPRLFARFGDMPSWMASEYRGRADSGRLVWMRIRPRHVTGRISGESV
jgi:nitroimidazol reductase NimA-like FMN-containing flavoprotein (pyridoxamine 5'-phosphate oxidase superfamily)